VPAVVTDSSKQAGRRPAPAPRYDLAAKRPPGRRDPCRRGPGHGCPRRVWLLRRQRGCARTALSDASRWRRHKRADHWCAVSERLRRPRITPTLIGDTACPVPPATAEPRRTPPVGSPSGPRGKATAGIDVDAHEARSAIRHQRAFRAAPVVGRPYQLSTFAPVR